MFGAIIGDIIGSTYELHNVKTEQFDLFPEKQHIHRRYRSKRSSG